MTSPTPPPSSTNGDARLAGPPAVSKKQLRKLAKAQFLAERKAERRAAVDDDDAPQSRRQRKRRNQRNCHRGQDAGTPDEDPDVEYVACTSPSCSGGEGGLQNRCQLRIVAPYLHRFQSFVKARWCGRSLGDVFFEEFEGLPAKYCVSEPTWCRLDARGIDVALICILSVWFYVMSSELRSRWG